MSHFFAGLLSSLFFFAVAGILLTPTLRTMVIARPLAIFFVAEGAWTLVTGILLWIHTSTAAVMNWVHFILMALAAGYLFYELYVVYRRGKESVVPTPEDKKKE